MDGRAVLLILVLLAPGAAGCMSDQAPTDPPPNTGVADHPRDVSIRNELSASRNVSLTIVYRSVANASIEPDHYPGRPATAVPGEAVLSRNVSVPASSKVRLENVADRYGVYRITAVSGNATETQEWYFADESYGELLITVYEGGIGMGWVQSLRGGERNDDEGASGSGLLVRVDLDVAPRHRDAGEGVALVHLALVDRVGAGLVDVALDAGAAGDAAALAAAIG